jgi:hypothetical protein
VYQDFREPVDLWKFFFLVARGRESITKVEDGALHLVEAWDAVVPGDRGRMDWWYRAAYKRRCEMGIRKAHEHGTTTRFECRCKLLDQPTAKWSVLLQSHVQPELHGTYPYGWTWNVSLDRRPHTALFHYDVWGRRPARGTRFDARWGDWWDFRIETHWSTGRNGWATCWLNGQQVAEFHGPNMPTEHVMEQKWGPYQGSYVREPLHIVYQSVGLIVM